MASIAHGLPTNGPLEAMPAANKLRMGSNPEDLLNREDATAVVVVMASSNNNGQDSNPAPTIMDPHLQMAARDGDCQMLEDLLVHTINCSGQTAPSQVESHFVIHLPETSSNTDATGESSNQPNNKSRGDNGSLDATMPSVVSLLDLDGVTLDSEEDSALHVVAASGDSEQYLNCADLIYGKAKYLLDAANKSGDTPLHCAAKAGNLNMVSHLIELATRENGGNNRALEFLRKKSRTGETALHMAICSANRKVIEKLVSEDMELVHAPGGGISPLYLAVSLGHLDIVLELMQRSCKRLSYSGPDGRNVLHAAVFQGKALSTLLTMCKDVVIDTQQGNRTQRMPLLLQLTSQRDKNGSTPLHLAASLESRSIGFSRWTEYFKPKPSLTTLLLEANESAVHLPDNKGSYPIHVAACNGKLKAVMILLKRCPNCAALRDTEGRTFLHVAIKKKRYGIVKFVCGRPKFAFILNAQDKNGDTALHLAVQVGASSIFNCLFRNTEVCLDLPNKDGLTPRDLSWIVIPARFYNKKNPRYLIHQALVLGGASVGSSRPDHFYEKYEKKRDENIDSEYMTNSSQVVGITSVLVETVTFAGAFTLPGSYRADDHADAGTPTLASRYAFDAFVISNALAFICSLLATISLLYSGVASRDISIRHRFHALSRLLLHSSVRSLVAAFAMGMYVVLAPVAPKLAMLVCLISSASLLFGNTGFSWFLIQANTLRVRCGVVVAGSQVRPILQVFFKRHWPYIIIFGLPKLLKTYGTN